LGIVATYLTAGFAAPWALGATGIGVTTTATGATVTTLGGTIAAEAAGGAVGFGFTNGAITYAHGGSAGDVAMSSLYGGAIGAVTGGIFGAARYGIWGGITVAAARATGPNIVGLSGSAWTENTLRLNVLANIAESQAARASSNIDVLFAKEAQLGAGYGADAWSMATLPKGSIVYGGIPGQSAFYTDAATILGSGGSRTALFQSLQAAPSPLLGYRPAVSMYEVLQDIRVPTGTALGNPGLGAGGANQFFIWNYANQLREVPYIPLTK
jgi:filamentous hemagglutinin